MIFFSKISNSPLYPMKKPKTSIIRSASEGPIFGKVHRMTPNHLDMFKVKNAKMNATCTLEALSFVRFAVRWAIFELRPNFRKSALDDPKWPWHVQGQKWKHTCYIHQQGPNLRLFRSRMSSFCITAQFLEKCTQWPKMNLTCLRSNIPIYKLHTSLRPKFSSVSLYDEPLLS